MTVSAFQITGLRLACSNTDATGPTPIARFSMNIAGVALNGCLLARNYGGEITVFGPFSKKEGQKRGAEVHFDPELRAAITVAVLAVYRAIAGDERDQLTDAAVCRLVARAG
ncbi:hypothetical protein [Bradyrhizobium stylosanthis]|uniref:hypothetical protein n=1 Tax=Bradyrhizobium stylosanthis TaxID=1803665 RepID=UPI0007C47F87|nr:hypothetical protein [Bradyrhizobium stylosanthis]